MKIRSYYKRIILRKKLRFQYEKIKGKRPAWIKVEDLPEGANFIRVHLGRKGIAGQRLQFYKTYIIGGLFLPMDYTKEEMKRFYDKWAEDYDKFIGEGGKGTKGQNIIAAEFLLKKIKKYSKKGEMLDLGAGTGLITEMFVKEGFYPATLVDYSKEMLEKAKKRKDLEGCRFIKADIRELNFNKKFDLVISFFSFGSTSYFDELELDKILDIADKHLKKNGIIAILGHTPVSKFEKKFKKLEAGIYDLSTKKRFYTDYFIGRKR